jgi:MoaA/NifB/PqqE/SkfB family radical SAM enzyme
VLEFAEVSIAEGNPAFCARCRTRDGEGVSFTSSEAVLRSVEGVVREWPPSPGPNVAFLGAEPFAHPELPLIVSGSVTAGAERLRLRTDAGALAARGNAAGVLSAGVQHIELVLLGGSAETHDALVGRPGLFDAARAGLSAYRAAADAASRPVAITGFVPLCRHTAAHLSETVSALVGLGAVSIELRAADGYAADPRTVAVAFQTATVNGVWLHGDCIPERGIEPWQRRGEAR